MKTPNLLEQYLVREVDAKVEEERKKHEQANKDKAKLMLQAMLLSLGPRAEGGKQ